MGCMEISVIDRSTIKLKGKTASFIVDPTSSMPKTSTDAILFLSDIKDADSQISKVDEARVIIKGEGSYEVGGARVTSVKVNGTFFYSLNIDGLNIFLTNTKGAEKEQDMGSCNVLVLCVDGDFKESMVSSFEPSVSVLYGEKAEASAKLLGKEFQTVSKFSQTADKLPADPQVVLLK